MVRERRRPVAQLYITRPTGSMLLQGVERREDIWSWVEQLAPLIPADATWVVLGPDEKP